MEQARSNIPDVLVFGEPFAEYGRSAPACRAGTHALVAALILLGALLAGLGLAPGVARATEPLPQELRDSVQQGEQALRRGDTQTAIVAWEQALTSAGQTDAPQLRADLHGRLASVYLQRGQYLQAVTHLDSALRLAAQADDGVRLAQLTRQLGTSYLAGGHIAEARQHLQEAVDLGKQTGQPAVVAAAYNDLGNLKMRDKAYRDALELYTRGADAIPSGSHRLLAAKARSNAAAAALALGQNEPARTQLSLASRQVHDLEDSHHKAFMLIRLGSLQLDLHAHSGKQRDRAEAHALFSDSLRLAESLQDRGAAAYALGYLGTLYEKEGRNQEALRLSQRAIFLAREAGAPESLYRWQWQAARLLRAEEQPQASLTHYRQAVATLDRIRPEFLLRYSGDASAFATGIEALYRDYVSLLLDIGMSAQDVDEQTRYLWEVQETMEHFKAAELQDYFQDECVALAQEKVRRIDQALPAATAVLYPIVMADRTVLLLTFASGVQAVSVDIDEATLNAEVDAFRHKLEKRTTRQYLKHAQKLYDWLIRPIAPSLRARDTDTLVLVPGGALRTIPLAALHDGQRFLVQQYALASTPGLELTDPRPINRQNIKVLLGGLTQPLDGFGGLPHVETELQAIQQRYGGQKLQDETFLTTALRQELEAEDYAVVHIASHGKFEARTEDSFILAFDDRLRLNELERYMSVSRYREDPVELLTLSACQTAAGDERAALGLAGVAVKAGARSALATLWSINDQATALLVEAFYTELQDASLSKAKALQHAQLTMLEDLRYRHPGYWSAFLLIGNWL